MSSPVEPEIIVEITLLPSEAAGRNSPILEGEYRGMLSVGEESFSVRFFVPVPGGLTSNATHHFGIQFLFPKAALPHFPVGAVFSVWEGRTIGSGKVLEVLASVARNNRVGRQ